MPGVFRQQAWYSATFKDLRQQAGRSPRSAPIAAPRPGMVIQLAAPAISTGDAEIPAELKSLVDSLVPPSQAQAPKPAVQSPDALTAAIQQATSQLTAQLTASLGPRKDSALSFFSYCQVLPINTYQHKTNCTFGSASQRAANSSLKILCTPNSIRTK